MIDFCDDLGLIKRMSDWNNGNLPERKVFAKGTSLHGEFRPYMSLEDYTTADFLCHSFQKTKAIVRLSCAMGSMGSGDTARDVKGFAVKFYTREGNCDFLSTSLPVLLFQDANGFLDLMKAVKPSEKTNLTDSCGYWKYALRHPEAMTGLLHLYGSCGIPKSYSRMPTYSMGTMLWRNEKNQLFLVRHIWMPEVEEKYISGRESEFLCGFDPDSCIREICGRVLQGKPVEYELCLQLIPREEIRGKEAQYCNPTIPWKENEGIFMKAGKLKLSKCIENFMEESEMLCFSPENACSGIEIVRGSVLNLMALIAPAAQRHRLGHLFGNAAINEDKALQRPKVFARVTEVYDKEQKQEPEGFLQAKMMYRQLSSAEREILICNIADHLLFSEEKFQSRLVEEFLQVDEDFGKQIAMKLAF